MLSESHWETLNQAFGYEVVTLLIDQPMSRSEIRSKLPYQNVQKNQIERIIDSLWDANLIKLAGERGADKFTPNMVQFSDSDLRKINKRAIARIRNPAEERGGPFEKDEISDEFYQQVNREDNVEIHHSDFANNESLFKDTE